MMAPAMLLERSDRLTALAELLEAVIAEASGRVVLRGARRAPRRTASASAKTGRPARNLGSPPDGARCAPLVRSSCTSAAAAAAPRSLTRTVEVPSSGFDWTDAGLGAAGMASLLGLGAGALVVGRRRRRTLS
jgi:hypothetical protein